MTPHEQAIEAAIAAEWEVISSSLGLCGDKPPFEAGLKAYLAALNGVVMPRELDWASKPEYEPQTTAQELAYFVEEAGETLAAVGKSQRWGLESYNPELPASERETNREWILREISDLDRASRRLRAALIAEMDRRNGGVK